MKKNRFSFILIILISIFITSPVVAQSNFPNGSAQGTT